MAPVKLLVFVGTEGIYHDHEGQGRVFFFALGHDNAVLENPSFQEVVRRGALWVGKQL